jgi:hypothetical protein
LAENLNRSLIASPFIRSLACGRERNRLFGYVGQFGNRRRETCLKVARECFQVETPGKSGFHGTIFDGDLAYLELLLDSRITLIPPGFFNNSNHRYLESLILGSIPAILYQNSLDIGENDNWTKSLQFPRSHSFFFLLKYLKELNQYQVGQIISFALSREIDKISRVRESLWSIFREIDENV